ncbi:MAG: hypothetical protein ACRDZV_14080, partial [Acidimicrobiia bacterium]
MRRRRRRSDSTGGSQEPSGGPQATVPPEPRADEPQVHYDEGVQLLQAAVNQVRGQGAAPVEIPEIPENPQEAPALRARRRRAGNGNGHGNGHGNGAGNGAGSAREGSTETIPAPEPDETERPDDVEVVEDATELDREPDHVAARRRWVARSRRRARTRDVPRAEPDPVLTTASEAAPVEAEAATTVPAEAKAEP